MSSVHPKNVQQAVGHELLLVWKFIDNDIWDTVIPCIITFITAWVYAGRDWHDFPLYLSYCLVYTLFYILTFCVSNQVNSVEEDRINKPRRPLVTGFITETQARARLFVYNILFLITALALHLFWLAFAWQLITKMLCQWGFSNHWATKNLLCISLGTITLLAAEWNIVENISRNTWAYIVIISLWAGIGLPLQDLRDQAGDRIMGRKTLPLAIGDKRARIALSIYFVLISPIIYYMAVLTQVPLAEVAINTTALVILAVELLWHWYVALRLWLYKTPKEDDQTYHWFVYLFCATIPVICFL